MVHRVVAQAELGQSKSCLSLGRQVDANIPSADEAIEIFRRLSLSSVICKPAHLCSLTRQSYRDCMGVNPVVYRLLSANRLVKRTKLLRLHGCGFMLSVIYCRKLSSFKFLKRTKPLRLSGCWFMLPVICRRKIGSFMFLKQAKPLRLSRGGSRCLTSRLWLEDRLVELRLSEGGSRCLSSIVYCWQTGL